MLLYAINVFVCSVCDVLSGVVWYGVCFVCACVRVDLNALYVWFVCDLVWFAFCVFCDCVRVLGFCCFDFGGVTGFVDLI